MNFPDPIFKARAVEVSIFEKIRLKSKGMTEREKKLARVDENTPDMQRMNRLFGRREDTKWTYYLAEGLAKFGELEEEEWRALEVYYARRDTAEKERRFLRSKLDQLINNLPDDIETARAWCRRNNRTIAFESVEQTNDAGEFYLDPESVIG